MIPDCTVVTCSFLTTMFNPDGRSLEETVKGMKTLLSVPCYMLIFTDTDLHNHLMEIRKCFGLEELTKFVVMKLEDLETFKYLDKVKENRLKYHPTKDVRTCAESHLITCAKFSLVLKAMEMDPFSTSKFGWSDSYVRENFAKVCTNYVPGMFLRILYQISDKFHVQILNGVDKKFIKEENLREYYSRYRYVVCGGMFMTGKEIGKIVLKDLHDVFVKHTTLGYGHGEEMFYLEVLDKHYDKIQRSYGDHQHILNNFIDVTIAADYILMIAKNFLNTQQHRECMACCDKMIKKYETASIQMDYSLYYAFLFNYYISSFYIDKEEAKRHAIKIFQEISRNPYIRKEHEKNASFYDSQYRFVL